MKVVFLDIDGVLNAIDAYDWEFDTRALLSQRCISVFNGIIAYTGAKVVLSSAWRYYVHENHMTVRGFEKLLRSHGVRGELLSVTPADHEIDDRGDQISHWIETRGSVVTSYVVLDDVSDESMAKHPFVHTNPKTGLTVADGRKAVALLGALPEYQDLLSPTELARDSFTQ